MCVGGGGGVPQGAGDREGLGRSQSNSIVRLSLEREGLNQKHLPTCVTNEFISDRSLPKTLLEEALREERSGAEKERA